jgi:hypothetical protein
MKTQDTKYNSKESKQALVSTLMSLSIALATCLSMQQAQAQEDSLLPPEVVPLDQAQAASMQQAQAQARQAQMGMQAGAGMQTAQQARAAAFDSLMNQGEVPPQLKGAPFAPSQASAGGTTPMLSSNTGPNNTQSQTLSGQVKQNNVKGQDAVHKGTPLAKGLMSAAGIGMFAMSMAMMFRGYGGGNRVYGGPMIAAPGFTLPRIGSGYVYPNYLLGNHFRVYR